MKTSKAIITKANIDKWDLNKEILYSKRNYHQNEQTTYRIIFFHSIQLTKVNIQSLQGT